MNHLDGHGRIHGNHCTTKEAVAIQLGRDVMELGIDPFLVMLVGEDNARRLWERHAES